VAKSTDTTKSSTGRVKVGNERVQRLKEQNMTTPAVIDNERIRIMMKVYEGTAGYQQIKAFTPEEVWLAGHLGRSAETAAEIAKRVGRNEAEVTETLESLIPRRLVRLDSPAMSAPGLAPPAERLRVADLVRVEIVIAQLVREIGNEMSYSPTATPADLEKERP
jgi:hypothetical protein